MPGKNKGGSIDIAFGRVLSEVARYRANADLDLLGRAYAFAKKHHARQKRANGADYIVHPVGVAEGLTELEVDEQTLAAALIHDVIEDCNVSVDELVKLFGQEVTFLVTAVTKDRNGDNPFLTFGAADRRVLLLKLADRRDNMFTLAALHPPARRYRIARETLETYVPIAESLGLRDWHYQLRLLALAHLPPPSGTDA